MELENHMLWFWIEYLFHMKHYKLRILSIFQTFHQLGDKIVTWILIAYINHNYREEAVQNNFIRITQFKVIN